MSGGARTRRSSFMLRRSREQQAGVLRKLAKEPPSPFELRRREMSRARLLAQVCERFQRVLSHPCVCERQYDLRAAARHVLAALEPKTNGFDGGVGCLGIHSKPQELVLYFLKLRDCVVRTTLGGEGKSVGPAHLGK